MGTVMYSAVAGSLSLDRRAGGRQNNVCHKALAAGGDQAEPFGAAGIAQEVMCWNVKRKSIMLYPERERKRWPLGHELYAPTKGPSVICCILFLQIASIIIWIDAQRKQILSEVILFKASGDKYVVVSI